VKYYVDKVVDLPKLDVAAEAIVICGGMVRQPAQSCFDVQSFKQHRLDFFRVV